MSNSQDQLDTLLNEEEKTRLRWRELQDDHPTYNNWLISIRNVDRFIDSHPELARPELDDHDLIVARRMESLETQNLALKRELESAMDQVREQRGTYGD